MPSADAARGAAVADQVHPLHRIKSYTSKRITVQREQASKAFFGDHISNKAIRRQGFDFNI
jgi:hypothetical protein